ncbi:hypothetical protein ILUMI_16779 [Ignelater luminosus]|uniref:Uncharacterized protein n=1 Tax=Ignelater luminosus TaxID=2038154 RepID=A0A8K0G7W6_IGNLU|nr:hypothetical protein ILUMI_16779 [Ignelater luminosus]
MADLPAPRVVQAKPFVHTEALLNSRPLGWLSSDRNDPAPLTPAHFLVATPLKSLPAIDFTDQLINGLNDKKMTDNPIDQRLLSGSGFPAFAPPHLTRTRDDVHTPTRLNYRLSELSVRRQNSEL